MEKRRANVLVGARLNAGLARLVGASRVRLDRFSRRQARIAAGIGLGLGVVTITASMVSGGVADRSLVGVVSGLLLIAAAGILYRGNASRLGYVLLVFVPLIAPFLSAFAEGRLNLLFYSWIAVALGLLFWTFEGMLVIGAVQFLGWAIWYFAVGSQLRSATADELLLVFVVDMMLVGVGLLQRYLEPLRYGDLEVSLEEARRNVADLEEAARLKNEFLAVISHEMRTPLNSVNGYADMLLKGIGLEGGQPVTGQVAQLVGTIKRSGVTILGLVDQILLNSKIEAGEIEVVNQPFAPTGLLEQVQQEMEPLALEKQLEFECEVDAALPEVLVGDKNLLRRVLVNLVSNAIKYTEKDGRVHVRLASHGPAKWDIRVSDTGIGIPPDKMEHIFKRFHQVDGSTEQSFGGTGLGLAICRELVIRMGGTIKVDSAVGRGSTFTAVLPLTQLEQQAERETVEAAS